MTTKRGMRSLTVAGFLAVLGLAPVTRAQDEGIPVDRVPKAVINAAKAKFPGAKIQQASEETEDEKTVYSLEMKHQRHNLDVTFKGDGTVVLVDTAVTTKELPKVVLRAVELSAGSVSVGLTRLGFVATTPFGIAALARVAGLVVLAWSASTPTGGPAGGRAAALGGVAVLAAFALVGHPQATPAASTALRGGLVAAQVTHVLMTAIWFGGICLLAMDLRARHRLGDPRGSAAVVARFSSLAGLAVVGVTATGLALARSQVDTIAGAPDTAYGRALIAKLGCVALVVAIGGYNRQFLVPAVERSGDTAGAWRGLRRTLLAEGLVIGGGVLVATAAMTSGGF